MHAKHHTKKVQRVTEAFRLSIGDQLLDVGCSIAALNVVGAHPLSRSVYNAMIVYLVIELHSGAFLLLGSEALLLSDSRDYAACKLQGCLMAHSCLIAESSS